jgi:hypothetical protein
MLTLFVTLAGALPSRSQDIAETVAKYVAWRGGKAFEHMHSVNQQGSIQAAGMEGTVNRVVTSDGRYRQEIRFPTYSETDVVTVEGAWTTNLSGQVVKLSPDEASDGRRLAGLAFANVIKGASGIGREELAPESHDGKEWSVVRFHFDGPDTYDLFVSAQTGELDGIRTTEDLKTKFIKYSDWRIVEGVRMPFSEVVTTEDPGETTSVEFTHIAIDSTLPTATFGRPADPKPLWSFSGGTKSTGWLPFDFFNQERIFIPAVVNGQETEVLLDSGADASALDRGFARIAGAKEGGPRSPMVPVATSRRDLSTTFQSSSAISS